MKRFLFVPLFLFLLLLTACGGKTDKTIVPISELAAPIDAASGEGYDHVDLDLSRMSGTAVYAQVYNMLDRPSSYLDKVIRVRGALNYFKDEKTGKEYFAALIADATACCAQGLEFVWAGEHVYPRDYPALGTEIIVTGRFELYEEASYTYVHLADAEVQWEG